MNGDILKKCRNDGMFFLLTNETGEHIAALVCAEVAVRSISEHSGFGYAQFIIGYTKM